MQNRPLRDFERGAHLHVLDWTHQTARLRLQAAGQVQVKAASKAIVAAGPNMHEAAYSPLRLPALEAAITNELRKLYAVGHATVRSELDHQASGTDLPIGLSAAPQPPNLRMAGRKKGRFPHCGTCKMYDASSHACWGYGNWPVRPNQVCDEFVRDPKVKTLALSDAERDPGRLRARAQLVAADVAHQIWQAVQRGRLQGISDPKALRVLGRSAGAGALSQAASHNAGGAINAGRHAAATAGRAEVRGARYTSILDSKTCGACAEADTGELIALDDPRLVRPPNPSCAGGDRCRCILVYQLRSEALRAPVPIAAGR